MSHPGLPQGMCEEVSLWPGSRKGGFCSGIFHSRTFHHIGPNLVRIMISSDKGFIPIAFNFSLIVLYLNKQKFKCIPILDKSKRLKHPNQLFLLIEAYLGFSRDPRPYNFLSHTIRQYLIILSDNFYPSGLRVSNMRGGSARDDEKPKEDKGKGHRLCGEEIRQDGMIICANLFFHKANMNFVLLNRRR